MKKLYAFMGAGIGSSCAFVSKTQLRRKGLLTLLVLFSLVFNLFAQAPPSNLSGDALKQWYRSNYFDGKHNTLGYTTARKYLYNFIDNKNNKITGVYSGYTVSWTYGGTGTNPSPINCEHTVPQSYFGKAEPMKSDIHHLFPTYQNWNSTRSNHPFAEIDDNQTAKWMYMSQSQTSIPSSNIDLYSEYANSKFEPREDHKGNVARAIFYFYTMYPTQAGALSKVGEAEMFYNWHLADPVDANEKARNTAVENYQGNRNPYIDYPETVALAFGFSSPTPQVPAAVSTLSLSVVNKQINLTWTDVSDETSYDLYRSVNATAFSVLKNLSANTSSYSDTELSAGSTYRYYLIAKNDQGSSPQGNTVSGSIENTNTGGNASELMITEYLEGSSYNKAIEISNFTGSSVDLSAYSIKKQANGSGSWSSGLSLSGSLANGRSYVIAHSSANTSIKNAADKTTTASELQFNGNDPVALFKGSTLIDIVGVFNAGSGNFAQDKTLIRKADITSPNTGYTSAEWNFLAKDDASNLGKHSMNGGTSPVDCDVPAGLSAQNISEASADLNWIALGGVSSYQLRYKQSSSSQWTEITANTNVYKLSSLQAETDYEFQVAAKCTGGTPVFSSSTSFRTKAVYAPLTYCSASGSTNKYEWIQYVEIGSIKNSSGASNGYSDFTGMKTSLYKGNDTKIYFQAKYGGYVYTEYWTVYIDYNRDGDFSDANERVASGSTRDESIHTASFTIPSTALNGETRLRILMNDTKYEEACASFTYGEVEDYTVHISETAPTLSPVSLSMALDVENEEPVELIYPNPASDVLYIQQRSEEGYVEAHVYSPEGKLLASGYAEHVLKLAVKDLAPGMYLVQIKDGDKKYVQKFIKK